MRVWVLGDRMVHSKVLGTFGALKKGLLPLSILQITPLPNHKLELFDFNLQNTPLLFH